MCCTSTFPATTVALEDRVESSDRLLSRLPLLEIEQLREQWFIHFHSDVGNRMSAKLLRMAIAHKVQELELDVGGRCNAIRRIAYESAATRELTGHGYAQHMKPGTRLIREYKGKLHEVLALRNGLFVYEGQIYKSLSAVACKIVGKRRSGTAFFGMRGKKWRKRNA